MKLLGKAIKGTASFIGKGFGNGKAGRGLWLVAKGAKETVGSKAYYRAVGNSDVNLAISAMYDRKTSLERSQ